MNKMIFKMLGVFMTVVLLAGIISACTQNPPPQNAAPQTTAETQQEAVPQTTEEPTKTESLVEEIIEEPGLDEVTLRFYFVGPKPTAADDVWVYVSEITRESLNAKFEINHVSWGDLADKLKVLAASGDNFDMCFDADWNVYPLMVNNGAYLGLSDLMPVYAPGLLQKYVDTGIIDWIKVNGEIMAMPWIWKTSRFPILLWRGDLIEQYGLDEPQIKTMEDVDDLLHQVKAATTDLFPLISNSATTLSENLMLALAAKYQYNYPTYGTLNYLSFDWNDPSCALVPIEQTEMYREAAIYAKKWTDDGIVPRDMISMDVGNAFRSEECFSVIAHWGLGQDEYVTNFTATATKEHALLYPGSGYPLDSPLSNIMAVNANAANPERAVMFMELLSTEQAVYDAVIYGIEGLTYVYDGDTVVFPEGMDVTTSNFMYWDAYGFWQKDMERPFVGRSKESVQRDIDFTSEPTHFIWPLAGLMMNTDPMKNEITRREALRQELGTLIEYGLVDNVDAAITEYIEKQKAAGVDKLVEESQKQVDAHLASR